MAQALSAAQLAYLAGEYSQMASTVQAYQNACASDSVFDPSFDPLLMEEQVQGLIEISQKLSNQAIATIFDDSDQIYRNLATITQNANKVAASLLQETNQISRIAGIAGAMINLATALSSGIPANVVSSIVACAKAVRS